MISDADIGHEVGDPNAHWDMRGELLSLSEPGPWGSMCVIRLVDSGEILDIGARGFIRTNGRPVYMTEDVVRAQRLQALREQRAEIDRQILDLENREPNP